MRRPKKANNRRHFTAAAQAAAIEARRRKQQMSVPLGTPEVFIVRLASDQGQYAWEIRRFGALVLERGPKSFSDPDEARKAGELALNSINTALPIQSVGRE